MRRRFLGILVFLLAFTLALGIGTALAVEEKHVSGTVYLKDYPGHVGLILDGDTILDVSGDSWGGGTRVHYLFYIRGEYNLSIIGSAYPFSVVNDVDYKPAIRVKRLILNVNHATVTCMQGDGILTTGTGDEGGVYINTDDLNVYAPQGDGIYSYSGNINFNRGNTTVRGGLHGVYGYNVNVKNGNLYVASGEDEAVYGRNKVHVAFPTMSYAIPSGGGVSTDGHYIVTSSNQTVKTVKLTSGTSVPALYTVSFNKNGHGSEYLPEQNVWRNGYAAEPGTLHENGWRQTGWYKEKACSNEWRFLNYVQANTTVYVGWVEVGEGSFGGDVTWRFDAGYLYIKGKGSMDRTDPNFTDVPPGLKSQITFITIDNEVTSIADGLFKDCTSLKTVQLPSTPSDLPMLHIGEKAFMGCTSLVNLYNPRPCHFGFASFYKCGALEAMRFHDGDEIEQEAFGSTGLWLVQLGDWMEVEKEAFGACDNLKRILLQPEVLLPEGRRERARLRAARLVRRRLCDCGRMDAAV